MEEMIRKTNAKVYFFGNQKYKGLIEKTNAEYREYSFFDMDLLPSNDEKFNFGEFFRLIMKFAADLLPELFKFCQEEQPDLIFMDHMSVHTKYLRNFLIIQDKKKKLNFPLPKFVNFYSTFAMLPEIYPKKEEIRLLLGKIDFKSKIEILKIPFKQKKINKRLGLNLKFDLKRFFDPIDEVNICCILMEIQPRADNLIHKYKFPGLCIAEHVRNIETGNEKLNEILKIFPEINPIYLSNHSESNNQSKKLIYVSLGTVSYNRISVFERIIEAFKIFDGESASKWIETLYLNPWIEILFKSMYLNII
jgi:UDP:flavonoid glycosyltransferase YjiC (YdhE family)